MKLKKIKFNNHKTFKFSLNFLNIIDQNITENIPSLQAKQALEVVMRQAELMCKNADIDEIVCDRVAEDKMTYYK